MLLRDLPHFLLGYVVGGHNITIHVLFPHMSFEQDYFVALTYKQRAKWLDSVFNPAVYRYLEAGYT